jgi:phosphohistidine swiveling domain-containing protein
MDKFILSIQNKQIAETKFSGGKGSNLSRLIAAGFNVPPFFSLSASLYQHIVQINSIDEIIHRAASPGTVQKFYQIRSAILDAEIPEAISNQIISAWKYLIQNSPFKSVAVRSSALAEDLSDHSFAGQLESYLDIQQDERQLLESIKKCWASLWNERVYHYISTTQSKFFPQPIAVIVQQMIPAEYAGVCFTLDPTDAKQQWMMIEAHSGIGEDIVGGKVNPVQYRVHRKTLRIRAGSDDRQQLFDYQKIQQLARICRKIERYFGTPQDIEWAFYQDKFYFLQSRPITTTARKPASSSEKLWSNYFFGERFPQPVSPLGWSILRPLIEKNAFREPLNFLGFHVLARSRITKCFYGRPYTKLEVFQALHSFLPTAYVSLDKRKLFYDESVSLRQSVVKILKNIFPILKSLLSTSNWIPPVHLRNWRRFLNYFLEKIQPLRQVNLQILSDDQLWHKNLQAEQLSDRLLSLHRWSITFAELIYHFISYLIQNWFSQLDAEQTVIELHRGLPGNKTVEMNIELWKLSRNRFHPPTGGWNRYLATTQNWKSFVQKFGHRSTSLDIYVLTFKEDINYILELVEHYSSLLSEMSPIAKQKNFKRQREELIQAVYQNLSNQSFGILKKIVFKILLNWSEQFVLLRENQRYYWHQALTINRKIFKELGKRFFDRGWLEQPEHIFFLTRDEIKRVILSNASISKAKMEQRLRQHQQWQKIQPPALIDESVLFQGESQIIGKKLVGIGVSPGVVSGKARVLTGLREMSQIQPGEILVVPTTDPGWTPLFGIIKGLVMEIGGVLSHGAIVAREFGIPAVTSVAQATSIIDTGIQITIDGKEGMVWIHDDRTQNKHFGPN